MSEEQKENGKEPVAKTETSESAPVAAKAPAAAAPAKEEPAPIPAGIYGKALEVAGVAVQHLGPDANGTEMVDVPRESLLQAGFLLRDQQGFDLLLSCAGVDWKDRRESVYHLYSTNSHQYLVLKVTADEHDHSPSLMPVWHAVDWHERESFDLMGIHYDGHTNLTRILMPNDWLGHPLRKNYKVDDPRLVWNER